MRRRSLIALVMSMMHDVMDLSLNSPAKANDKHDEWDKANLGPLAVINWYDACDLQIFDSMCWLHECMCLAIVNKVCDELTRRRSLIGMCDGWVHMNKHDVYCEWCEVHDLIGHEANELN